jgi:protein involved in polysaccharide export with SLBB domain
VLYPGTYILQSRAERITDLLQRAGGLTAEAYPEGISVTRGGTVVAADIERAIRDPRHNSNIRLEAGDSINIPTYDPTVNVIGAVTFASRVLYRPGRSLSYYLEQAGGTTDRRADKRRITVSYPSGERAQRGGFMGVRRDPSIRPGSTIFIPEKPEQAGFNLDQFLGRTLTIVSTAVTLLVAVNQLK